MQIFLFFILKSVLAFDPRSWRGPDGLLGSFPYCPQSHRLRPCRYLWLNIFGLINIHAEPAASSLFAMLIKEPGKIGGPAVFALLRSVSSHRLSWCSCLSNPASPSRSLMVFSMILECPEILRVMGCCLHDRLCYQFHGKFSQTVSPVAVFKICIQRVSYRLVGSGCLKITCYCKKIVFLYAGASQ